MKIWVTGGQWTTSIQIKFLLTVSMLSAVTSGAALAQDWKSCPSASSDSVECTIDADDDVDGAFVKYHAYNAADDDEDGGDAGSYTLNNHADITATGQQNNVLYLRLDGGSGYSDDHGDATDGGAGGAAYINNSTDIALKGTISTEDSEYQGGGAPGVWDDVGSVAAIYAAATGGTGGDAISGVGHGDGGSGGRSGQGWITNEGNVTVDMALPSGGAGIYGAILSGSGQSQNSSAGDQDGGNGGPAERVFGVENFGTVTVTADEARRYAWGIGVEAIGGRGGAYNGHGGEVGKPSVSSTGTVKVTAEGSKGFAMGVRGIYVSSIGGSGYSQDSSDSSDNGGYGAVAQAVEATISGNVTVISHSLKRPDDSFDPHTNPADKEISANVAALQQSGGIVLYSRGGDGGAGPSSVLSGSSQYGGTGGEASYDFETGDRGTSHLKIDNHALVDTQGNFLPGAVLLSVGGIGGEGRVDSNGSSGGYGGDVLAELLDGAGISTTGKHSAGLVARSQGGPGGNYNPASGFVDFTSDTAGNGGAGGHVVVNLGVILDDQGQPMFTSMPAIVTQGQHSAGVVAQSSGSTGGETGDSFQFLGQSVPQTGYGGAGGSVQVNAYADIATQGDDSRGIVMQSIGSSGGSGGDTEGIFVLGGVAAGAGGDGGSVSANLGANVTTVGDAGTAVLAQSIGGGGGTASDVGGVITVGGQGGSGGNGGSVDLEVLGGSLVTHGDFAYGIVGQSIGGGGGDGGSSFTIGPVIPAVAVGGDGDVAGNGGDVLITNTGDSVSSDVSELDALSITTYGDNAHGVAAQSIGGGGGSGGNADGHGVSLASLQMTGGAESGGDGGLAKLALDDVNVTATGSHAIGLVAQSIGGGGGSGGSAYSYNRSFGFGLLVGIGGIGGDGGSGSDAEVSLIDSDVITGTSDVTDAHGIVVQSIGGGGGMGGSSVQKAIVRALGIPETPVKVGLNIATSIGGKGGSGGNGGFASAKLNNTRVTTYGDGSIGLIAMSVGGGGGAGGSSSSIAKTPGGATAGTITIDSAVGGTGGNGGAGGEVNVSIDDASSIKTFGHYANAVLAQSIGGGGGSGAVGSSDIVKAGKAFHLNTEIGVGGIGGDGGSGGNVNLQLGHSDSDSDTLLQTFGSDAYGVIAQSIGGGGGLSQGTSVNLEIGSQWQGGKPQQRAVEASAKVSVGAVGGGGGSGSSVEMGTENIVIHTEGGGSDGILLQSVGGGGGLGGATAPTEPEEPGVLDKRGIKYTLSMAVNIGGTGGVAGDGGTVTLDYGYGSRIETLGDWAHGVMLQSIGGGGGLGASVMTISGDETAEISADSSIAVGGQGGSGGNGGDIVATFNGSGDPHITTDGYMAYGIVLQSIGGGGGQGANGASQGSGTLTVGAGYGGNGGATGDGGSISIGTADDAGANYLRVRTQGDEAIGLLAQSIGGGGGLAGMGSDSDPDLTLDLKVGGQEGAAGNGGTVALNTGVSIATVGDHAYGLVAQSVGGGGGIAVADPGNSDTVVSLGGNEMDGNGGQVTLSLPDSWIETQGNGAVGIVAQSIGGGGGIAGHVALNGASLEPDTHDTEGNGSDISIDYDGEITTYGDNAHGIVAQSIGGGGGLGHDSDGNAITGTTNSGSTSSQAGAVTINQSGSINVSGLGAVGIFAQSEGAQNGTIDVTINGSIMGGDGAVTGDHTDSYGKGVWIANGKNNLLTIKEGASVAGANGLAIMYDGDGTTEEGSTLTVDNYGTIEGSVALYNADGDHAGTLNNYSDNTLIGASSYAANIMNAGRLVVGDPDSIDGTEITGDFRQTAEGTLVVDVDLNNDRADLLAVNDDAELDGSLAVSSISLQPDHSVTVVSVDGTISGALNPQYSPIYDFALNQTDGKIDLSVASAHFETASMHLHDNQSSVAGYLQGIWNAGAVNDELGRLYGALGVAANHGTDTYADMLSDFSPAVALAPAAQMQTSMVRFNNTLMSCPQFFSTSAQTREGECYWGQVSALSTGNDSQDGVSGYDTTGVLYQIGRQSEIMPGWFVDASVAYRHSNLSSSSGRVAGDGDTVYIGAALKREINSWLVAGAFSASYGSFDMKRYSAIPGFNGTAKSSPEVYSGTARLRVARTFASAHAYLKPYADLDAIYARMSGYHENGDNVIGLDVDSSDLFTVAFSPTLEVGGRFGTRDGMNLRPYAYAGATLLSNSDWTAKMHFAGVSGPNDGFDTTLPMDDVVARVGAGIEVYTGKIVNLRLQYDGEFSGHQSSNNASLKVTVPFGS